VAARALRQNRRMPITLTPEATKQLVASIKRFTAEHLDEEVGDLKAALFLDFCLAEVGAVVYNQAIADAQQYFQARTADLDGVCYQPEFSYWKTARKG
jgi:uncharacterized protein (DUF2164 family)